MYDSGIDRRRSVSLSDMVVILDAMLDSKTKRHIVGGILLSVSFLFGGLALTAMTIKEEIEEDEEDEE